MYKFTLYLSLIIITLSHPTFSIAEIINVPDDFDTIQEGIDEAEDGDTVLVAPGRYFENLYIGYRNLTLASLIVTTGDTAYIDSTIIDGDEAGSCITIVNLTGESTTIRGFTITNGLAYGGGGISCSNSDPKLIDLHITENQASQDGIEVGFGGGLSCFRSSPYVSNVSITHNRASSDGGGIHVSHNSSPFLTNVVIKDNSARDGGGIHVGYNSTPDLVNVRIINNSAQQWGGAIWTRRSNLYLDKVLIAGNDAGHYSVIISITGGEITFNNVTIFDNYDQNGAFSFSGVNYSLRVSFLNCIFGHNSESAIKVYGDSAQIVFAYNNYDGTEDDIIISNGAELEWGEGNINLYPRFSDWVNGDYTLSEESPCIDAGTDFFVWNDDTLIDLDEDEFHCNDPDMGAFESEYYNRVHDDVNPVDYVISSNYPNPFNSTTTISFSLPVRSQVSVNLLDESGRSIRNIYHGIENSGYHTMPIDAVGLPSGLYFARIEAEDKIDMIKMSLVR